MVPSAVAATTFSLGSRVALTIKKADITREHVDAIVNASNQEMRGGGGVNGAIHRAAGPELDEHCVRMPQVRPGVRCPTGEAVRVPGFRLPARYLINTVGPVYSNDEQSAPLLRAAYRNSIKAAAEANCKSIAFPALSCGVFGYPLDKAASVAMEALREALPEAGTTGATGESALSIEDVRFCLVGDEPYKVWVAAARHAGLPERKQQP